jgi:tRNA threonylcarbamoyladenosine biosynthesis protein TsaB
MPSHCAGLPDAVDEVLDVAGLKLRDLSGVAVGLGPGSFTGLRIGLSYAKGVASAAGIALAGVSSLDAIALCACREFQSDMMAGVTICPVIDARRGEVYAALYRFADDALERVTGDLAVSIAELATGLIGEANDARDVIVAGGAKGEEVRAAAEARGCRVGVVTGSADLSLRGSLVAALGAGRIARNEADDNATLEPIYVRSANASIQAAVKPEGRGLWNAGMKS